MNDVVDFPNQRNVDRDAYDWAARLDRGALSEDEKAALKEWIAESADNRAALIRAAEMWDRLSHAMSADEFAGAPGKGGEDPERGGDGRFRLPRPRLGPSRVAACIGALAVLTTAALFGHNAMEIRSANGVYETEIGEQRTVALTDGSQMLLNTASRVSVEYSGKTRSIRLESGEANFDVAPNARKPFVVLAGEGSVNAIGTEFSVKLTKDIVEVIVAEGRVGVRALREAVAPTTPAFSGSDMGREQFSAIADAGKRVVFGETINAVTQVAPEDLERELLWRDGVLAFHDEPLSAVVDEIARYTAYDIRIADPELQSLRVGGYFPVGKIETIFTALKDGFGLTVEELEDNVFQITKPQAE